MLIRKWPEPIISFEKPELPVDASWFKQEKNHNDQRVDDQRQAREDIGMDARKEAPQKWSD
jgi:hypothetical protein